ncbi:MAG: YfhO family protein, partial [Flavobacteriaceae bacterium]
VAKRIMSQPFQETQIDRDIAKDGTIFRVFDPSEGINGSRTSYFHQSIGGYHAAKPAGMQDLFEYQIYKGNTEILNMLNVRYVVQQNAEGGRYAALNTNANGNAWFIESLQQVTTADGEISALDSLNTKKNAVVNTSEFTGINRFDFQVDSLASISLVDYQPNQLRYESTNPNAGIAVFSEMHYPHGWNAYVDGKKTDHFKVNYVLRALRVPEGKHTIEFKFEPEVIKKGSTISLAGSIALGLIVLASLGLKFWQGRNKNEGS